MKGALIGAGIAIGMVLMALIVASIVMKMIDDFRGGLK